MQAAPICSSTDMYLPPDEKKKGAPFGLAHGRAKIAFEIVEQARSDHEAGMSLRRIAEKYQVPRNTIIDWVYYRTRCYA